MNTKHALKANRLGMYGDLYRISMSMIDGKMAFKQDEATHSVILPQQLDYIMLQVGAEGNSLSITSNLVSLARSCDPITLVMLASIDPSDIAF